MIKTKHHVYKALLAILLYTICHHVSVGQTSLGNEIIIGKKHSIRSKILGEDRFYSVHLPTSYNNTRYTQKKYPVLYLMDGEMHFTSTVGLVHHMSAGINWNHQIPELIIVAIHNYKGIRERRRDLSPTSVPNIFPDSGGGIKFLEFIKKELIPEIEQNYHTRNYRILAGHSLGGLMALHSFLEPDSPYDSFIAIDPSIWWDNSLIVKRTEEEIPSFQNTFKTLYLSTANNGAGSAPQVETAKQLINSIQSQPHLKSIRSKFDYFDEENHGAVPLISMYEALKFIFNGYNEGYTVFRGSFEDIKNHYSSFSEKIGQQFLPPEDIVVSNANSFIKSAPEKAIKLFKMNITNYPESIPSYLGLANAYKVNGDTLNALINYKEVLKHDTKNAYAKKQIASLNK